LLDEILGHGQPHGAHADEADARHLGSPALVSVRLWGGASPAPPPDPPTAPLRRTAPGRIRWSPLGSGGASPAPPPDPPTAPLRRTAPGRIRWSPLGSGGASPAPPPDPP